MAMQNKPLKPFRKGTLAELLDESKRLREESQRLRKRMLEVTAAIEIARRDRDGQKAKSN